MSEDKLVLVSNCDKVGILEDVRGLVNSGWTIVGFGKTVKQLNDAGIPAKNISDSGMLNDGGKVKIAL